MEFKDKLEEARYYIEETNEHVFLTGDGGTGKTTLLKSVIEAANKKTAVLAPTGVAALNAGGQTIHSFYGFRSGAISYDTIKNLDNDRRARLLHDQIERVVIDEISMVRADLMDNIANFYHKNYKGSPPFGGKQIIMVGDLDQLPPVVASDEERAYLDQKYGNEFFISANVWKRAKFRIIKLDKVFRQSDPIFIDLLNRVKNNKINQADIDLLNEKCLKPEIKLNHGIVLAATNKIAANINAVMLSRIEKESFRFEAVIEGDFKVHTAPCEPIIELKVGARVMICVNDPTRTVMKNDPKPIRNFVNGTMGELTDITPEKTYEDPIMGEVTAGAVLHIKTDSGKEIKLGQFTFDQKKYVHDEEKKTITQTIVGSFTQFPVKLAYAITVHKSQGSTLDKVIIDLGRGAFAHGQVYVALSRCRTLEGITLRVPMKMEDLIYNDVILEFNKTLIQ